MYTFWNRGNDEYNKLMKSKEAEQYEIISQRKEFLLNSEDYLYREGHCDYCGKSFLNKDMNLEIEDETISAQQKSALFGGILSEKRWHYRLAKMCHKCKRVHKIVGCVHIINGFILIVGSISIVFNEDKPHSFYDYFFSFLFAVVFLLVITRLDWFLIKILLGTRRKPKADDSIYK